MNLEIVSMKCNRVINPMGFSLNAPRLSWITEAEEANIQLACQVKVALDKDFVHIVHDSGKRNDIDSIGYTLQMELKPYTKYYWQVHVWTDCGNVISPVAWFETSKMDEPWTGKWITPDWQDKSIHPLLRKRFRVTKEVLQARLYVMG